MTSIICCEGEEEGLNGVHTLPRLILYGDHKSGRLPIAQLGTIPHIKLTMNDISGMNTDAGFAKIHKKNYTKASKR